MRIVASLALVSLVFLQQQTPPAGQPPAGGQRQGRGGGGGFRQPDPYDFDEHEGWTSLFDVQSYASDVNVESDGTILVVGRGGLGMAWARVTPAGVPDPAFGNGGTNSVDLGRANALAVRPGCFAVTVGDDNSSMTSISATIARFAL